MPWSKLNYLMVHLVGELFPILLAVSFVLRQLQLQLQILSSFLRSWTQFLKCTNDPNEQKKTHTHTICDIVDVRIVIVCWNGRHHEFFLYINSFVFHCETSLSIANCQNTLTLTSTFARRIEFYFKNEKSYFKNWNFSNAIVLLIRYKLSIDEHTHSRSNEKLHKMIWNPFNAAQWIRSCVNELIACASVCLVVPVCLLLSHKLHRNPFFYKHVSIMCPCTRIGTSKLHRRERCFCCYCMVSVCLSRRAMT